MQETRETMEDDETLTLLIKKVRLYIGPQANIKACTNTHVLINLGIPIVLWNPKSLLDFQRPPDTDSHKV